MIRRALLLLALAAAATPLAAGIALGPERTFADLRPGPAGGCWMINTWAEGDDVVTILDRRPQDGWVPTRMTIRGDGTADPKALVALPIPRSVFKLAPFRGGMIAAWSGLSAASVALLDRDGKAIEGPKTLPVGIDTDSQILCNDARCLVVNGRGSALLDEHAAAVKTLDRYVAAAVAGPRGFLLYTLSLSYDNSQITVLDNDGTARNVRGGSFLSGVFDGERYVVLTSTSYDAPIFLSAIDPTTGASSVPVLAVEKIPGRFVSGARLAWNGSMYLITMQLAAGFRWSIPNNYYGADFATMRVARSFAPIDGKPRVQNRYGAIALGVPGGFRIVYNDGLIIRTARLTATGQIVPRLNIAPPALLDRVSQYSVTAAASRSAILGVYKDYDGAHRRILAARIARDGTRLDATPLTLAVEYEPYGVVAAASDGDGFLVVWAKNGQLFAATIDAAGNVQTFAIGDERDSTWRSVSIDFVGGAYQVAAISDVAADAITIASTGAVVQRERTDLAGYFWSRISALFDGRRLLMLASSLTLSSLTKDVPGGALNTRMLSTVAPYEECALLRDGDGALALMTSSIDPRYAGDHRTIVRISRDGEATASALLGDGLFTSALGIVRIDGVLHATYTDNVETAEGNRDYLVVIPLDATRLTGGAEQRFGSEAYRGHLVAGWNGEGLLFYDAAVPTASGIASQMAVRVVHAH